MRFISWNVNGLRACLEKGFASFFAAASLALPLAAQLTVPAGNPVVDGKLDDKCYENLLKKMNLDKESLFGNNEVNEAVFIDSVAKFFPSELYEFINSNDWYKLNNNPDFNPDLSLHTKLRTISRFIVPTLKSIEEISSPDVKARMKELFSIVYEQTPSSIVKGNNKNTFKVIYDYNDRHLHAIFNRSGKMSTIYVR